MSVKCCGGWPSSCSSLAPSVLLFDGTFGRIMSMWVVLIVTIWFAYDNVLDLAYVYLCPVVSCIVMALYPMSMSSVVLSWMALAPYAMLRIVWTCSLCTLVSHLIDSRGWSEHDARWIPFVLYAVVILIICQARGCRTNKMCYTLMLAAQYVFFLSFFPMYMLASKGMTFISDANMIATLRLIVLQAESLPILPPDLLGFLESLLHSQCDHLFVAPTAAGGGDSTATPLVFPNKQCTIRVPIFFRILGGVFEGSRHHTMTVKTSTDAQYIYFNYRPGSEYFFDASWYTRGSQGIFRGMLTALLVAFFILTIYVTLHPNSRSQHLLKNKLIENQRRLYKSATVITECMKITSPTERVQERVCLMPLSQGQSLLGRTRLGNHFIKKYTPPNDLENMHSRIQDLTALVNSCHLESAVCQKPGLQAAPGLKGIQTALTHEAVMLSALARAVARQTGSERDLETDKTMWHHPIAKQIIMGDCQVIDLSADNRVCATDFEHIRNIFLSYYRISQYIERSLSLDELWGREAAVRELILELRHALQVELTTMLHYLKSIPARSITDSTVDLAHIIATFGYCGIEKAKAGILYLEGESEKKLSKWFSGLVISIIGPVLIYASGIASGWRNVFTAHKAHKNSCPARASFDVNHCLSFRQKSRSSTSAASNFMSKNGSSPVLHNAEVWAGFRYWIGDVVIFAVFLFRLDDWTQHKFTQAQKDHMTNKKVLGDSLTLSDDVISVINKIVKPSNDGAGMKSNIVVIPDLLWASVPLMNVSKLVGWVFLGYLCSNLITYQGTIKRTCVRFSAMLACTLLAWFILWISLTKFGSTGEEPDASDTNSAFALDNQNLRYWTYTLITIVGCGLIAISVTFFANPFSRRYGYDPQFGYFGQIICYHFLVITLGLLGDPRQTRDELCICRILGHVIGSAISVVLSLVFFPSDVNKQQQIRLSNMTVTARRSFIALNHLLLHYNQEAAKGTEASAGGAGGDHPALKTDHSSGNTSGGVGGGGGKDNAAGGESVEDKWRKFMDEQLELWKGEMDAYQASFDDASIGDSFNVLEADKKIAQMADIMKHKYFQRTAALRAFDNFRDGSDKIFEKDHSFRDWLSTNSPLLLNERSPLHKDHSDLRLMRLRHAGLRRPVSPYAFFEDDPRRGTDGLDFYDGYDGGDVRHRRSTLNHSPAEILSPSEMTIEPSATEMMSPPSAHPYRTPPPYHHRIPQNAQEISRNPTAETSNMNESPLPPPPPPHPPLPPRQPLPPPPRLPAPLSPFGEDDLSPLSPTPSSAHPLATTRLEPIESAGEVDLQVIWISVEQGIENLRRSNFDWTGWNAYTNDLIHNLQERIKMNFQNHSSIDDWPVHLIYKIWLDEFTSIRRIIAYINEHRNQNQK